MMMLIELNLKQFSRALDDRCRFSKEGIRTIFENYHAMLGAVGKPLSLKWIELFLHEYPLSELDKEYGTFLELGHEECKEWDSYRWVKAFNQSTFTGIVLNVGDSLIIEDYD